ncbi:MAG TPA: aldehyde ferredoxin oxidoreductase family protein [Thermodesulfobacteriota bacterium]|nr:aldehyde ferredoxin oxidoreductase family protein [Thermodesulfobacteriota bacterium]
MDYFGYMGKVCHVDLTTGTVSIEPPVERDLQRFLGCSGYAAKMLWDGVRAKVDPLSDKNKIVFATGPLTGSLCPSGGSYELCFKSPLTGVWCQARSGGAFGPRLKKAGFDHLVVEGKSDRPVYLWIRNGNVEIREASHLWGKGVEQTTDVILQEIGDPDASVAAIGVAGENQVHFAAVINDRGRAAGRGGGGAILGSKNLKAVAANGTLDLKVAEPEAFIKSIQKAEEALDKYPFENINQFGTSLLVNILNANGCLPTRYFQYSTFDKAEEISGELLAEKYLIKRRACYGCSMGCGRYSSVDEGKWQTPPQDGPEYETINMLGALCLNSDLASIIKANYLCNDLGMDTISAGSVIAFAMECFEKGILTKKDLDGEELRWGDSEAVVALLEKIAQRRGIGKILADGVRSAAAHFGADTIALHSKGMELPAHEPRGESKTLGLQYAVSHRGACHMHPNWASTWDAGNFESGLREFGMPWPPADKFAETGHQKGVAYRLVVLQGEIVEILGCCVFHSWGAADQCLTPQLYGEMLRTLTGREITNQELMLAAERSWNLKRCFNVREGLRRKDDALPELMFKPLPDGPNKGLHMKDLQGMLDEYYEALGWDKEGIPTRETLKKLDLEDIAKSLGQ